MDRRVYLIAFTVIAIFGAFANEVYDIFALARQQQGGLQGAQLEKKLAISGRGMNASNASFFYKSNTVFVAHSSDNTSSSKAVTNGVELKPYSGENKSTTIDVTSATESTTTEASWKPQRPEIEHKAVNITQHYGSTNNTTLTVQQPLAPNGRRIHRFCNPTPEGCHLWNSPRLVHTEDLDSADVWWIVECMGSSDIANIANNSIVRRIEAHLGTNYTGQNLTKETMNEILGDWRIILFDYSDKPSLEWLAWFLGLLADVVGWERVYFVTRSTTTNRWVDNRAFKSGNYAHMFDDPYLGRNFNFTVGHLGKICAGAKRFHFAVRDDLVIAMEEGLAEYTNGTLGLPSTIDYVDLPRPKDAAHFWERHNRKKSLLRCAVSRELIALNDKYPDQNLTLFADIVGNRGKLGRTSVSMDYVRALLAFKIIIVAQRDRYEDHMRLFESLISGAMVMSDPAMSLPYGVVHNETIIIYRSLTELQDQVMYYLDHSEERLRIARAGRDLAMNHHRGMNRYEDMILGNWSNRDAWGASIPHP